MTFAIYIRNGLAFLWHFKMVSNKMYRENQVTACEMTIGYKAAAAARKQNHHWKQYAPLQMTLNKC